MTRDQIREEEQRKTYSDQIREVQKNNADHAQRFSELEGELRRMNGKLEVIENKVSSTSANVSSEQKDDEKMVLLVDTLSKLDVRVQQLESDVVYFKEKEKEREQAAARSHEGRIDVNGKSVPKTTFDLAEEQFEAKDWKKAVLNYQKFREKNSQSNKLPIATYKIGVCFQELGMKEEAKTFYDEVINKYPKAPEAKKSQNRVKALSKK